MSNEVIKVFLVDEGGAGVCRTADTLDDWYEILDCRWIDVVERSVDGVLFDVVCDVEGLFCDAPVVTAVYSDGTPALVGNIAFCHHDEEGNLTGISAEEAGRLQRSLIHVEREGWPSAMVLD